MEVGVEAVPIVVESTTEEYFVLYVRHDLDGTALELPVSVTLGENGTSTLAENVGALPKERYLVEKFLIADPADVDGDCIDDITELGDPAGMNPVNPAAAINLTDGAVAVPDRAAFEALSSDFPADGLSYVKFVLFGMDTDRPGVYFANTETHPSHYLFYDAVGLEWDQDGTVAGQIGYRPELAAPDGSLGVYFYWLNPLNAYHPLSLEELSYTVLAASMPLLEANLALYMSNDELRYLQSSLPLYSESRIPLVFDGDIFPETRFLALNPGEGYGLLRVMDPDERPHARDVVIYEALPNELPRVAGIISTVPQTPLSHVNLRAIQDGVPNAYIRDALNKSDIGSLLGNHVRYEVTDTGYSIRAATRAEVDAHYASFRPAHEQTPQRDLSITAITPLSEIGFGNWTAFGVKAANVAVLGTLGFPEGTVPDGFAIPFYFYDEFMKHNGFYANITTMLADPDFQANYTVQESELKKLRKAIKKGETPGWITAALEGMHEEFPNGTSLRYRSSTNNEDLPGFSGAGLYDSKTQHPEETEEDGVSKSLKQVYASLWNFRAFAERDFHRINHTAAAMGVLVHPNYSDELVNGVAVSFDPLYGRDKRYYVNTQLGEDLVTNPDAHSVPEEILLHRSGGYYSVLATSNQVPPGQLLMSNGQLAQLGRHLAVIHEEFRELYNPGLDEQFAMEIEFKITSANILAIKQARPWVFSTAAADTTAPTVTSIERSDPAGATTSERTLVFAVTFSEDVTGVSQTDFGLSPDSTGGGSALGQFAQTSEPAIPITDHNTIQDAITVSPSGTATSVSVAVDISHAYIGDLVVELIAPDGTVQALHSRAGDSADSINRTYTPDFGGTGIAGDWILRIRDHSTQDTGTLNGWTLTVNHGGADSPVTGLTGSGDAYLVTVSAAQNGTYNLDLVSSGHGIADAANNQLSSPVPTGADHTYAVGTIPADTTAPTVTSIERSDPAEATTSERTLVFAVTFSEDVTGVDLSDFALSPGGTGTGSVTNLAGSGSQYLVSVSAAQDGSYNLDLVSSGHGIADAANNPLSSPAPTGADHTYTVSTIPADTTAPTLASIERHSPADQNTDSQTLVYKVTFSEDVTGVDAADFALSSGSTGGTSTGSGQFTQTRSPALAIPYNQTVSDAITVPDSGTATSVSVAIDIEHDYIGDLKIDLIAPDDTAKTLHDHSGGYADDINQTYTPDFGSVPIAGDWTLRMYDNYVDDSGILNSWTLTINHGGTATATSPVTSASGSGSVYYATVSAAQDGTYNLDLVSSGHGIADTASNPLTDTVPTTGTDHTYTVSTIPADTTAPTLASIERYSPAVENTDSQTLVYKVTFSEDVTGVDLSDFALSTGSTGGGSGSGQFTQTSEPATRIADRSTIQDAITVDRSGTATSVSVAVDITHTYIGDLVVDLIAPDDTTKTLHSRAGGSANDIDQTYTPDLGGTGIAGDWTLRVSDRAGGDVGTLNGWTLTIGHGTAGSPVTGLTGSGDAYLVTVSAAQDGTYNLDLVSSGHGIADTASNPLTDTVPTTGTDHTYTVSTTPADTTAPTLASIERSDPSGELTPASILVFEVTFSEAVQNVDAGDFELSGTGAGSITVSTVSGDTYNATVAVNTDGTFNLNIAGGHNIEDLAGTGLSSVTPTGADQSYTVDRTAPAVTSIVGNNPSGELTSESTLVFEVTFSESVTGVDQTDFVLSSGGTGAGSVTGLAGSGSQYLVTVSAAQDGTYNLDVTQDSGIADTADNPLSSPTPTGADHTYTVNAIPADTAAPTVTSIARSDPAEAATSERILVFAVTFSEDVTGVDAGDFALSPGSTGGGSGSGQFTQTSEPATRIADRSTIQDAITVDRSGTATSVSVAVDITHTYIGDLVVDLIAPDDTTKTLHSRAGGSADDIDQTYTPDFDGTGIAGDWILRVSDRAGGDVGTLNGWTLTIGHGTTGSPVTGLAGSGSRYLVTVSAAQDGTYNLDLVSSGHGIADTASNPLTNTAPTGTDHTYTVSTTVTDSTAPTLASIERSDPSGELTPASTLVFGVTFSEDVTGVDLSDFALSSGGTGTGSVTNLAGSGSQYLVTVSAAQDGTYNLDLVSSGHGITDSASNPLSSPAPTGADHTYTVSATPADATAPTVTSIERSDPAGETTSAQTLVFAVTFSEDVTGVDLSDFALSPDSTGGSSSSGQFTQTSEPALRIADRSTIQDAITVDRSGTATSVSVAVDISHTYRGDLVIVLIAPDGTSQTLHSRTGGSANDIDRTYAPGFDGTGIAGDWTLRVSDRAGGDVGTLNGWTLTIGHGTAGNPVTGLTGSGDAYLVTVSAAQDGTYNLDLVSSGHGIADTASNPLTNTAPTGTDHTYTVSTTVTDSTAPTLASIERSDPSGELTPASTLVFGVTFSEDVTGVDLSDFALSSGGTGTGSVTNLAGSGSQYLVTVSAAQDGTYNLDLVSSGHGITDSASNPLSSPAPTGADHTYTVSATPADATAPTVTSIERSDPAGETTSAQTLVFAVTFSEDVTGVDLSDFALSPDSTGGSSSSGQFTQTSEPALRIADRSTIQDAITVDRSGTATSVSVAVDISHTYRGDLVIVLIAPDGTSQTLHSRTGGSANDIDRTYAPGFDGTGIAGDWTLRVSDRAGGDVGTLNGWTLTIGHGGADSPVTGLAGSGSQYLVTVSAAQDGTYNLDLVSSGHGITDTADNPLSSPAPTGADHTYTVRTPAIQGDTTNTAPSVSAGPDQTVQGGQAVSLTGTATDADGDPLTYSWSHDSALAIEFANSTAPSTTFTAPQVSSNTTFTLTLTVDDGTQAASDSMGITIVGTPGSPRGIGEITLASTGPGVIVASWEAPTETPADYRMAWAKVGEPYLTWTDLSGNAFPTSPSQTVTGLEEGEQYKVKVRARYSSGGPGDWSGEFNVTVAGTG